MNKIAWILLLFVILITITFIPLYFSKNEIVNNNNVNSRNIKENFTNLDVGNYPTSESDVLLEDSFPITGKNGVSTHSSTNTWWYYPQLPINSYKQITNNLKYHNNPDNGTCTPSEFCGTLYKDYQIKKNVNEPLPPVEQTCGSRINYYNSPVNLLTFRNITSILY